MKQRYVVYFDDGTMLAGKDGGPWGYCTEFPEAHQFTSKRKAEDAAKAVYKHGISTVEPVEA